MGVEVPEEYNGSDSTFFNTCLLVEEIAKVDMGIFIFRILSENKMNLEMYTLS